MNIRDEFWTVCAAALLVNGGAIAVLGLLPRVGFSLEEPSPDRLVVIGLIGTTVGAWILLRPVGMVLDPSSRSITMLGPVSRRHLSFMDVSHVEIQGSQYEWPVMGLPTPSEDRYDVVLRLNDGSEIAVHRSVRLPAAHIEARRLGKLTGLAVSVR